ncbi:hypothetical protein PR048_020742 [Dryococelus australis]|uniref:Pro-resilin n=1 Tax=Dryococelus australis TaxID=614101 RepID=A0ABQ9H749_9NEOP|nr:hypothetical protein PR048_020742 [Dryococelus australis]
MDETQQRRGMLAQTTTYCVMDSSHTASHGEKSDSGADDMQLTTAVLILVATGVILASPQLAPLPYDYSWKVEDAPSNSYYNQREAGDANGRVDGSYQVWLPDGRLMTISYYVDGESGYVPKITYEQNANPFVG